MATLAKALSVYRSDGITGLAHRAMPLFGFRSAVFRQYRDRCVGRRALEIGGPSAIFSKRGLLPIYPLASTIDNVNFSNETIWEGMIAEGKTFHFAAHKMPGHQFIAEGAALGHIPNGAYDLVLSSHTIEHTANPLKALGEWRRVLQPDGMLILVAPDKARTFDHRRPITPLSHMVEDLENDVGENDLTHLSEILRLHDLSRDPGAGTPEQFRARSEQNAVDRCLHHHVFDLESAAAMVREAGFRLLGTEVRRPHHLVVIACPD